MESESLHSFQTFALEYNSSLIHLKHLTRLSLPKEGTGSMSPLPRFACTHQLPATLLITHCSCKLIQLRETSLDDYKMLQSQYCFRPAESKFIKHLLFKAAVVINACLHLWSYNQDREKMEHIKTTGRWQSHQEPPETKAGDGISSRRGWTRLIWSHSSPCNEALLEQKQQQTPVLLRQEYRVCSCWLDLIKASLCQGQGQGAAVSLLPSTTHAAAGVITDAPSMCAEHIKRINSSEFLITALLLLWTFAMWMTLQ